MASTSTSTPEPPKTPDQDESKSSLGYPTVMGYPPPPHGHLPPPSSTYQGYPTVMGYSAQPPPTSYFSTTQPYNRQRNGSILARRLIIIMFAVVIVTCMLSLILWFILRPQLPIFQLQSFSVPTFNITNDSKNLSATFDITYTVENPNSRLKIAFSRVEGGLFYETDRSVVVDNMDAFRLSAGENLTMAHQWVTPRLDQPLVDELVVKNMNEDVASNGDVVFDLFMVSRATLRAGSWWIQEKSMKILCADLSVRFVNGTQPGSLIGGSRECDVWM